MLNESMSFTTRPKFTLRKLPMWGKTHGNAVNFEWPTQEMLDRMPTDTRLESITFKVSATYGGFLGSVQCHLTNGESSPEIKSQDGHQK